MHFKLPSKAKRKRVQGKPVDFRGDPADRAVKLLKRAGFTTHLIMRKTGYTESQVGYRVRKAGLTLPWDYRRGETDRAKKVLARIDLVLKGIKDIKEMAR
jgi:hypothetical protein